MIELKVLQIIKGFDIGGPLGGAENFGINLSLQLAKEGVQVAVCSFYRYQTELEEEWYSRLIGQGIPVIFASEGRQLNLLRSYKILQDYCRKNQIRIVHSHFQVASLVVAALKLTGAAQHVIRTAHTTLEWGRGLVAWVARQILTGWAYPLIFDAEVGVSQAIVDQLKKRPGSHLISRQPLKISNAIPLEPIQNSEILIKSQTRGVIIGSVGRLTEQKGYCYLIEAVPEIINEFPALEFWLIGDGELRGELEKQCKVLGVQDRVKFLGKRNDVLVLLRQLDLFVLPSLWEGLPTVIMESMSQGVPVLATNVPGTREMIEDGKNGWLVEPRDPSALAKTLIRVLRDPEERLRISQDALRQVDRFSINTIALLYLDLYQRIRANRV
jgi:glycosyltransferase involved in cell wall biosynthesis